MKKVDFNISFIGNEVGVQTQTVSVFVNVEKGLAPTAEGEEAFSSTPRVIIDSYSLGSESLYAGDTFDLSFTLKNTSEENSIENLQVRLTDDKNMVLPANNGSNSIYVERIGKGESVDRSISLQTAANTEASTYTLTLDFVYESGNSEYKTTETISVPIQQKIRLKFDDPMIYDDAWVNQSVGISVTMYNLGKAPVNNCMVSAEGEGITLEEGYFGGNVGAGSTMQADFTILPTMAGDLSGNVVITYEDANFASYTEKLPFTLFVSEEVDPMMGMEMEGMYPGGEDFVVDEPAPGIPGWVWFVIGGAVVLAGLVVLIIILKKRRARSLEDLDV